MKLQLRKVDFLALNIFFHNRQTDLRNLMQFVELIWILILDHFCLRFCQENLSACGHKASF